MKKILPVFFALALLASCASTPKTPEPAAQPAVPQTQTESREPVPDTASLPESQTTAPEDGSSAKADSMADTEPQSDYPVTNTAETEEPAEMEMVAEEDILKNESDDTEAVSIASLEPEILDAPPVTELEFSAPISHELAETMPDAEGTTSTQQQPISAMTEKGSATAREDMPASAKDSTAHVPAAPSATTATTSPSSVQNSTAHVPVVPSAASTSPLSPSGIQPESERKNASFQPAFASENMAAKEANSQEQTQSVSTLTENTAGENGQEAQIAVPSRTAAIKNNQYLDIVYPGSGWVYLGEAEENKGQKKQPLFSYFGRKLGTSDTTFTLRSRKPGKTLLHFYKNDALTGQYIDDYLEVTIDSEGAKAGVRATAPAYAEVVPPAPSRQTRHSYENTASEGTVTEAQKPSEPTQGRTENTSSPYAGAQIAQTSSSASGSENRAIPAMEDKGVKTVVQTTASAPAGDAKSVSSAPSYSGVQAAPSRGSEPEGTETPADNNLDLLEQAKRVYAAKQYEDALDKVQRYLQDATTRIDEALYLQGQVLEAESSVKSIRSAIDSYESLTKNYPMSSLWGKANNRIIYLKRFYIEIR